MIADSVTGTSPFAVARTTLLCLAECEQLALVHPAWKSNRGLSHCLMYSSSFRLLWLLECLLWHVRAAWLGALLALAFVLLLQGCLLAGVCWLEAKQCCDL